MIDVDHADHKEESELSCNLSDKIEDVLVMFFNTKFFHIISELKMMLCKRFSNIFRVFPQICPSLTFCTEISSKIHLV